MKRLMVVLWCTLTLFAHTALGGEKPAITLENWVNHPDVKEVRAIQTAISNGAKNKKYTVRTRRFDVESLQCSAPYPLMSKTLYLDANNRPVWYHQEQLSFDDEIATYDRYYDANGKLRFYFLDRVLSSVRVYFDRDGKEFLAIKKDGDRVTLLNPDNWETSWETAPNTAAEALEAFGWPQECPEVKKLPKPGK
jgi:hypothetical protein